VTVGNPEEVRNLAKPKKCFKNCKLFSHHEIKYIELTTAGEITANLTQVGIFFNREGYMADRASSLCFVPCTMSLFLTTLLLTILLWGWGILEISSPYKCVESTPQENNMQRKEASKRLRFLEQVPF
jgi:hypothetical protein